MNADAAFNELRERGTELRHIQSVAALIDWDQSVFMPPGGGAARGAQSALLAGLSHERLSHPRVGELLAALEGDTDPLRVAAARNLGREHRRAVKAPAELVKALAAQKSVTFEAWIKARQEGSWAGFQGPLTTLLAQTREWAAAVREPHHAQLYDALLEGYDAGSTVAALDPLFERLGGELNTFLAALDGRPHPAGIQGEASVEAQRKLHAAVAKALGYDFGAGRLDEAEHPFSTGIAVGDTRITTHYYADSLLRGLSGTIHEAGHGMYEQGIPKALWLGTGADEAASYGLHESQSRFWENFIGRSLPFCRFLSRLAKDEIGLHLDPDALFAASNRSERSLIRIFADESTYNLHIIVRYGLERELIDGRLAVADLPEAWAEAYAKIVGVRPASVVEGALQDVHWSAGLFGYFPSYTLGNLTAASLGAHMVRALPGFWEDVEAGRFEGILAWLRENVHAKGHLVDAPEIVHAAVGERDAVADLIDYLWSRQGAVYGVAQR